MQSLYFYIFANVCCAVKHSYTAKSVIADSGFMLASIPKPHQDTEYRKLLPDLL